MRQFELRRSWRGKDIIAHVLVLDEGVHVSLYGGDRVHIGAVGIIDPDGNRTITQFPGHKEGMVCEQWMDAFVSTKIAPIIVEAGIHYDHLSMIEIQEILLQTHELAEESISIILGLSKHI